MSQRQDSQQGGGERSPGSAEGEGSGGIYDRYIDNDNAFDNLVNDLSSLPDRLLDFSWLLPDQPLGGTAEPFFGGGILGILLTIAFAAALAVGALAIAGRIVVYSWRVVRHLLFADPGEVKLGYLCRDATTKRARLSRLLFPTPVARQCYDDTLRHWQIIAPTGGGKTTFLDEKVQADLRHGVTPVILELDGVLGAWVRPHARLYDRQTVILDPSDPDTSFWNPMAGADTEKVAEQMVNMVASDYVTQQFFRDIATVLTRHAVIAVKSYQEHHKADANLGDLMNFIADRSYRDKVLEPHFDKNSGATVTAEWLPRYTKWWFETIYFGQWNSDHRDSYTTGLSNVLEVVYGNSALRRILTPPGPDNPDGPQSEIKIEDAIESGALVMLRLPTNSLGPEAAVATASWLTQRIQQETRARSSRLPLSFYLDEAHLILGKENVKIAEGFRHWLPVCRNFGVSLKLSYQSYSMIEYSLRDVIQGNARSKFISGGLPPNDADEAERIAGDRDAVFEEKRTSRRQLVPGGILSSLGQTVTTGRKEGTEPHYPAHHIQNLPPGRWLVRAIDHNRLQDPYLIYVPFKKPLRRRLEYRLEAISVALPNRIAAVRRSLRRGLRRLAAPVLAPLLARLQRGHQPDYQDRRPTQ